MYSHNFLLENFEFPHSPIFESHLLPLVCKVLVMCANADFDGSGDAGGS